MKKDFCSCLTTENISCLKKNTDIFLKTLDSAKEIADNFSSVKEWLSKQACVKQVTVGIGMLRSDPPMKEFYIDLDNNGEILQKTIVIEIEKKQMHFATIR